MVSTVLKHVFELGSYFCYKVPSSPSQTSTLISDLPKSSSSQRQTVQALFLPDKRLVAEIKPQRTGHVFVI